MRGLGRRGLLVGSVLAVAISSACTAPPPPPGPPASGPGYLSALSVSLGPLQPTFSPDEHDYGVICAAGANSITVSATPADAGGTFALAGDDGDNNVSVNVDQLITLTVTNPDTTTENYYIRCLPPDFPQFSVRRVAPGVTHGWYLMAPGLNSPTRSYVGVFDEQGAVLWYKKPNSGSPAEVQRLPNGNIEWGINSGAPGYNANAAATLDERTLAGTTVHSVKMTGVPTDFHDWLHLPNGNVLMMGYHARSGVNVDALQPEFSGTANVLDAWLQELQPDGTVVWEWHSEDHIGTGETVAQHDTLVIGPNPIDLIHINSVELASNGDLIISARHTDSLYKIRRNPGQPDDGKVLWKLGGNAPTEPGAVDLAIVNDPYNGMARQHDARLLPNGHITAFDNRTKRPQNEPARAVEYAIDEGAATATLVWWSYEPALINSCCLGSVRRYGDGATGIGWGGVSAPMYTEVDSSKNTLLEIIETHGWYNYRVLKYDLSAWNRDTLRANAGGTA